LLLIIIGKVFTFFIYNLLRKNKYFLQSIELIIKYKKKYSLLSYLYFYFRWIAIIPFIYLFTINNLEWLAFSGASLFPNVAFNMQYFNSFSTSFQYGMSSIPGD